MEELMSSVCSICGGNHSVEACPKKGLGAEMNGEIADKLTSGDYIGLLGIIDRESDKKVACEVVLRSMAHFNTGSRAESVNQLIETALSNIDQYGSAMKELVLYSWRNNLQGERFFKNPRNEEVLFVDDDSELISFQGKVSTHTQGDAKGMNYIESLGRYTVLTGPNSGKVFDGSYEALQRHDSSSRPIKGPSLNK